MGGNGPVDFSVDIESLRGLHAEMQTLIKALEMLPSRAPLSVEAAGSAVVSDAAHRFATQWRGEQSRLLEKLRGCAAHVRTAADAYARTEDNLQHASTPTPSPTTPTPAAPPTAIPGADKAIAWFEQRMGDTDLDRQCLKAVYQAYLEAAGLDITAGLDQVKARDNPVTLWEVISGKHEGDPNPPRGALLFFRPSNGVGDGHIAISLGDGQMITTWDGLTDGIHTMPINAYDPRLYLGWAPPK